MGTSDGGKPKRMTKKEREAKRAEEDSAIRNEGFKEGYAAGRSAGWRDGYCRGEHDGESQGFGCLSLILAFAFGVWVGQGQ